MQDQDSAMPVSTRARLDHGIRCRLLTVLLLGLALASNVVMAATSVQITAPINGATKAAPATFALAADATGTVSQVRFAHDGITISTDYASPYTASFSTSTPGTYTFKATATDGAGEVAISAPITVTVTGAANVPPAVSFTAPGSGATAVVPASFTLTATASDSDGTISSVAFYSGSTLLSTDGSAPYSATFATSTPGTYSLTAVAVDNAGASTTSSPISVTVTPVNAPPTVSLVSPANGATAAVPASFVLTASASDSDGTVSSVAFYSGSTLLYTDTSAPYTWTFASVPVGSYAFTAKATDNAGAVTTSSAVNVTVTASQAVGQTRTYVYDANQRLCKRIEPETGATLMDYDAANNIAWTVTGSVLTSATCDRASVSAVDKFVRTYDALNRPLTVDVPNSTNDLAYGYFADGALQTLTSGPSTWTYTYNKRRLPVTEQLVIDGRTKTITHAYNVLGQESTLTYPSGLTISTLPNALGQPTQANTFATGISYFANGGMSGFSYGNGIVHSLTQNVRQLPLRSLDIKAGNGAILDDTYSYDANANVGSISDGTSGNGGNRGMQYDGLDRLTSTNAPHQWWINATTSFDTLDNIRSNTVGNRTYNYAYDPATQRLRQLTRPDATVAMTLGYDANGNVTSKGTGQDSYVFDAANRMTSVATKESYVYDGYGRRVKVTRLSDSKLDYPIYTMGGQLLTDDDQRSNTTTDYINLNGSLVAKNTAPIGTTTWTTTYEHTDALHSPISESNAAGTVTRIQRYTPYGEPSGNTYTQGPGFTGHVTDAATGLTYAQQRYYDPVIGRFLSVDPVAADGNTGASFNRYNYAGNNPYKFTDPDGRQECDETCEYNDLRQKQAGPAKMVAEGFSAGADIASEQLTTPSNYAMAIAPEAKVADVAVDIYRGSRLARAMVAEGRGVIKGVQDAHHIVAKNAVGADAARAVLKYFGIGVDEAVNGVALNRAAHQGVHTADYYARTNRRLEAAKKAGEVAVRQELRTIGAELSALNHAMGNVVSVSSLTITP